MNRINPTALGLAMAITAAVLNLACAGLVAIAPGSMVGIFQTWWHGLDVSMLAASAQPMTLKGVATGVMTLSAFAFIVGFVFGVAYNAVSRRFS